MTQMFNVYEMYDFVQHGFSLLSSSNVLFLELIFADVREFTVELLAVPGFEAGELGY